MEDRKKVLVIDDEPDTRTFLTTLLEDHGYDTAEAADGVEALAALRSQRPDLITLDVTMPEKSGVGFYRELRSDDDMKDIPVIMITGVSADFERFISTRSKVPPPEGYMAKPIDQEQLLALAAKLTA